MRKDELQEMAIDLFGQLQIPYDERFSPYVEEGFWMHENLKDYAFDKERICRLNAKYGIFDNDMEMVLKSAEVIRADGAYSKLCYIIISFLRNRGPLRELKLADNGEIAPEFVGLFAVLYFVEEFVQDCRKRGIPQEIIKDTLRGINCIDKNRELTGYPGIRIYLNWLSLYIRGEIYHISGFSFQIVRKGDGEDVISVHIPSGIDLSTEKVIAAFANAEKFFKTYFPEYQFTGFICQSWMLNPKLEEIMGKKTKVSQFGDLFERYEVESFGKSVYRFVFNRLTPVEPRLLSENTSMQRAIKQYLLEGNLFKDYGGFRKWSEE